MKRRENLIEGSEIFKHAAGAADMSFRYELFNDPSPKVINEKEE
jgi:hypothetical protein